MLKLAQETPDSVIPSSGIAIEKHALTGSRSLSPLISPPKQTDKQPISSYPNDNATSMFTKESRANPLDNSFTHKPSGLRDYCHLDFGQESAFNNEDLEPEGDQIGTSAAFNVLASSTRIYSNDMIDPVECRPRQILQNMWPPAHSGLIPRFVAPNPLPHASTFEPVVNVAVPLNAADPLFAEGIIASHEADSAIELQLPSNQSYSYIEANTELDEEIAALTQSWLKEQEDWNKRQKDWNERLCEQLCVPVGDRTRRNEEYKRFMECYKGLAASGQPRFEWKSLPNFAFAYGGYIMGRVREFVEFFVWR
jgi:hypothetical protein